MIKDDGDERGLRYSVTVMGKLRNLIAPLDPGKRIKGREVNLTY